MRTASASAEVRTPTRVAIVNVTGTVRQALDDTGMRSGLAVVSVPHTTCALTVNEDEAGLREDLVRLASRLLVPLADQEPFHHDRVDDNARAHLTAVLIGHSATLPVVDGDLRLGAWQSLFLLEMDGPRTRRLEMTFLGE
ncbi:MAG TPA: secondary thiamine-phosphate synthase enzyme YjbQ [Candidatus Polarisedimenticolia bacterium]|nr:secondary thiamine-phosphate synthase enzyme YjbQ [Candidatus Polarisedimenticolia bacterium]